MSDANDDAKEPVSGSQTILKLHEQLTAIWATGPGIQRLAAVNHTVLGVRFMVTALIFFAVGGVLGMLTRVQLATPLSTFMDPETYNQVFTMHGSIMLFLFAVPMIEGVAVYLTPKILGTRDFAFPRLTAYGYWCYLFGGSILTLSLVAGVAPNGGWFMYTPLSSNVYTPGINADVWLLGVTFVEISALTLAVEIVVSILTIRAPGMSLDRMPIFGWYILATAMMMVVAFPPLILGSILLEVERAVGLPFFDPTRGGDPLLWQHLFWLFGHPDVYIIFLPMAGLLSTMIPVLSRTTLFGYRAIVVAVIGLAFASFGIWVHHMFTVGIPHLALAFFSTGSALVTFPTAVQLFAWLATMAHGRPRWNVPMLYVFGFFSTFIIGGLTGVMLAIVPFDWQAHDTYFVVAHFHYVAGGAVAFPLFGALYYWLPLLTGKTATYRLAVPAFWLIFVGFNLTFFLMHLVGLLGMPRRIYTYPNIESWADLNLLSSVASFIMTIGFALAVIDLLAQLRYGKPAPRDPWKAGTLEWTMPLPAPAYAFASLPRIAERADRIAIDTVGPSLARGEGYLGFARNGWQETLGVDMTSGEPEQILVLPRPTYLPLWTALATAAAILALLAKLYITSAVMAAVTIALFVFAGCKAGLDRTHGPLPVGHGISLPVHTEAATPPAWWALIFTLVADATLFTSLVFGQLFLWISAPHWPPPSITEILPVPALGCLVLLIAGCVLSRVALRALQRQRAPHLWIALTGVVLLSAIAGLVFVLVGIAPQTSVHAAGATAAALLTFVAIHAGIGCLFLLTAILRLSSGRACSKRPIDLRLARLWIDYTAVTGAIAIGLVLALPTLVTMLGMRP